MWRTPSSFFDGVEENFFSDGIFDALNDAHRGIVAIWKTLIRPFTHEGPRILFKIPFALDYLLVVLFEAFGDFHFAQRLHTPADVQEAFCFRKTSGSFHAKHLKFEIDGIQSRRFPFEHFSATAGDVNILFPRWLKD